MVRVAVGRTRGHGELPTGGCSNPDEESLVLEQHQATSTSCMHFLYPYVRQKNVIFVHTGTFSPINLSLSPINICQSYQLLSIPLSLSYQSLSLSYQSLSLSLPCQYLSILSISLSYQYLSILSTPINPSLLSISLSYLSLSPSPVSICQSYQCVSVSYFLSANCRQCSAQLHLNTVSTITVNCFCNGNRNSQITVKYEK